MQQSRKLNRVSAAYSAFLWLLQGVLFESITLVFRKQRNTVRKRVSYPLPFDRCLSAHCCRYRRRWRSKAAQTMRSLCHDVCVCECVCSHDKTKTPDRTDSKFGTVVMFDSMSKPIHFGFNRYQKIRGAGSTFRNSKFWNQLSPSK